MKLFKKDRAPSQAEAPVEPVKTVGKGRATPKRKDAQARRLHPIVPVDRKAARREARAKRDEAWERQRPRPREAQGRLCAHGRGDP